MSTTASPDPPGPTGPLSDDVAPTWRDLPTEPPYGPVRQARTAHIGPAEAFAAPTVEDSSTISARQIALALGGTLVLVAVGIGAALLLLREDPAVATADDPPAASASPEDEVFDLPALPTEEAPQQPPQAAPPQGQLEPQPAPGGTDPGETVPDQQAPDQPAPGQPAPGQPAPGTAPSPPAASEAGVDLPRLFVLRTLPSGMAEESTTVRQTTRDDDVVLEQTTLLDSDDGEVTVRATRVDDAQARLDAMVTDDAEELSVQGLPAFLLEPGRLVWLLPSDPETLMEIVAPDATRTDQLLTLGNGLELQR